MEPLQILTSYAYLHGLVPQFAAVKPGRLELLIDSGAFTAYNSGRRIDLPEYLAFLKGLPFEPWRYFALDVVGDPEGTARNLHVMLDKGYRPVPIFTRGEPVERMEELYAVSDLVGYGGLVASQAGRNYLKFLQRHIGDRRAHWLGVGDIDFIAYYKPYSVDTSSVSAGIRFGQMAVYLGRGKWENVERQKCIDGPPSPQVRKRLEEWRVDWRGLGKAHNWCGGTKVTPHLLVPSLSFIVYQRELRERYGTRYFLSIATPRELRNILIAEDVLAGRLSPQDIWGVATRELYPA